MNREQMLSTAHLIEKILNRPYIGVGAICVEITQTDAQATFILETKEKLFKDELDIYPLIELRNEISSKIELGKIEPKKFEVILQKV